MISCKIIPFRAITSKVVRSPPMTWLTVMEYLSQSLPIDFYEEEFEDIRIRISKDREHNMQNTKGQTTIYKT
jgi:hypothetical protein